MEITWIKTLKYVLKRHGCFLGIMETYFKPQTSRNCSHITHLLPLLLACCSVSLVSGNQKLEVHILSIALFGTYLFTG